MSVNENEFNNYHELLKLDKVINTIDIEMSHGRSFIEFRDSSLLKKDKLGTVDTSVELDMNYNWKIHISIDPKHLSKAWQLIYPLLKQSASLFKVLNENGLKNKLTALNKKLEESKSIKDTKHLKECEQQITAAMRFKNGMQITAYCKKGDELRLYQLAQKIEKTLSDNNIKPGVISKSDRALGKYASYRHPGINYINGTNVKSYNPNEVFDPILSKQLLDYISSTNIDRKWKFIRIYDEISKTHKDKSPLTPSSVKKYFMDTIKLNPTENNLNKIKQIQHSISITTMSDKDSYSEDKLKKYIVAAGLALFLKTKEQEIQNGPLLNSLKQHCDDYLKHLNNTRDKSNTSSVDLFKNKYAAVKNLKDILYNRDYTTIEKLNKFNKKFNSIKEIIEKNRTIVVKLPPYTLFKNRFFKTTGARFNEKVKKEIENTDDTPTTNM
jgi:hypothetical protein